MISIKNKADCCGCTACANACPKNCIEMLPDEEGFLYPNVNEDECVDCGLCDRKCPIINRVKEIDRPQKAYLVQHKNDDVRLDSSAGGAFTAIAEYVLHNNGVVFGVQYDKELNVIHSYIETIDDLYKYRNSKYVQSYMGDVFKNVQNFLNEDRWVCFSGTPCQIEGLNSYLGKSYKKLILVDVVCHAVPSPLIWNKYKEYLMEKYSDITHIRFRDKYYGYRYSTMSVFCNGSKEPIYHEGIDTDYMLRAFFSDICDRPSCYDCKFKKRYRVSDFTIWDCFTVGQMKSELDDNKGTTRVLIHSDKGVKLFDNIKENVNYAEITADEMVAGVKEMYHSVNMNEKRQQFFIDALTLSGTELGKKYFPNNIKCKCEKYIRVTLCKLGIYDVVKKTAKYILRK
jgi:NAD-dependent dihydropyrimidine dehydrogenase PreA subunit